MVQITSAEITIGHLEEMGISISIPENSLGLHVEFVNMYIRPCFSGPFELPDQYESASPAYLIHSDEKEFQKNVTIRMHHYASLQSEEDCEDMAFLSASPTPEYRGSHPVYIFKKIRRVKGIFRPGDQVGEISLRHFCYAQIGIKRERGEEMPAETVKRKKNQGTYYFSWLYCNIFYCVVSRYYSARLYRNVEHQGAVSAAFCVCFYHPMHIKVH